MCSPILDDIKNAIRVKTDSVNGEIEDLIAAAKRELEIAGVYITDENEPTAKQAIRLYCKANFGYDENTERFREAYEALRDSMALSGEYRRGNADGSKADMVHPQRKG